MNDRIKLAEAMGWVRKPRALVAGKPCGHWKEAHWLHPNGKEVNDANFPDPFTDANDDYAVLEWMRDGDQNRFGLFKDEMHQDNPTTDNGFYVWNYQIGDYARAALKVIDD